MTLVRVNTVTLVRVYQHSRLIYSTISDLVLLAQIVHNSINQAHSKGVMRISDT